MKIKSRKINGRLEYEVQPGRWVSRQRVHQMRNRKAHRARVNINEAIRNGKLQRGPCERCGAQNAETHHYSYDDPYAIIWLCKKHHKHPRPRLLSNAPLDPDIRKAGRPFGKSIPFPDRILQNRIKFGLDA